MKSRLAIILSLIILFWAALPVGAATSFADTKNHWAKTYITRLAEKGYLSGYPDGTFRPDETMTKGAFVVCLLKVMGVEAPASLKASFPDTQRHWARSWIEEALNRGIIIKNEYSSGFKPDEAIKRSEVAAMVVRALGKRPDNTGPVVFRDRSKVEKSKYRGYIKVAYEEGLVTCFPNGEFKPFEAMTRAQACTILARLMDRREGVSPDSSPQTPAVSAWGAQLAFIKIEGTRYDWRTVPVYIKLALNDCRVNELTHSQGYVYFNRAYRYPLAPTGNFPEMVVYNNRYKVTGWSVEGDCLAVTVSAKMLNQVTVKEHKYNADYVRLFVNKANKKLYLADMELTDNPYVVKIQGQSYDLGSDEIVIMPSRDFYRIKKVLFASGTTTLELEEVDPVIVSNLTSSDIAAIFVGNTLLDKSKMSKISFVIGSAPYDLRDVEIDAQGSFTVNEKTVPAADVLMIIDGEYYKLNEARLMGRKVTFYASSADVTTLLKVNGVFRKPEEVRIVKGDVAYDWNKVLVVKKNVIRLGGKQYNVDDDFRCILDKKVYKIEEIDYDNSLNLVVMTLKEASSWWLGKTLNPVFYYKGRLLYQGSPEKINIYTGKGWTTWDKVNVNSPFSYTSDNTSYDLIGTKVRLGGVDYRISDAVMRAKTQVLELYLEDWQ